MKTTSDNSPRAIHQLGENTISLFHRLRFVADQFYGGGEITAVRRGILRLLKNNQQTVPDLARQRGVSRQTVQKAVNALLKEGVIEYIPNPAHKKSRLVSLTDSGHHEITKMADIESAVFKDLELPFSDRKLIDTASFLKEVTDFFESEAWQNHIEKVGP